MSGVAGPPDAGTVTEEISQVIWRGGKVPPGYFQNFAFSTTIPDNDVGKSLTFKTLQTAGNGRHAQEPAIPLLQVA